MPVYVIGHQNPDTDSICAAIGYADLLRRTHMQDAIAAACGTANTRTEFVLKRAGQEHPHIIMDVRPTAGELCRRKILYARREEPFMEVYRRMQEHRLKTIPVIDGDHHLLGMVPLHRLMGLIVPDQHHLGRHRNVHTSLQRIRSVLGASFQHQIDPKRNEELIMMVGAMNAKGFVERLHKHPPEQLLIVLGDRPTVQEPSIDYGVRCIVITGSYKMPDELLERAREKGVSVINSPLDTAMTTLMIKGAQTIEAAIETSHDLSFSEHARLQEIRAKVKGEQPLDLFPVMSGDNRLVGVFAKSDLVSPEPAKLVLVDHNELAQAVNGADEARILEVIDHHRVGGSLVSREPIRFHNEPVGSTCTIIARMYRQQALVPDSGIALCLASGIISDTLFLRSPTTTEVDRDILGWLETYTDTDLEAYSQEFFAVGSALSITSPQEILASDRKEYDGNGWTITISQVEELGMERFWERKEDLEKALRQYVENSHADFSCVMITDITKQASLLLCEGSNRIIDAIEYPSLEHKLFELPGVVSRKKQLLPQLMWILSKVAPGS